MIKRILVVGGAGYIGGSVTDYLLEEKLPFTVYDNLTYENHYLKPVDFIFGDIRDRNKLRKILPDYTHVVWLAAIVGDGACAIRPALTKEVNQDAVEFLAKNFNGRIIFTSTCSVYGQNRKPVSESSPTNPLSIYAQTKLKAESFLQSKNSIIFRLGTAYGLSDTYSRIRMDLAINYMTMTAVQNKKLAVFGGKQWRPFIHVRDISRVITDNLMTDFKGVYNLTMHNATIIEIAELIGKETGSTISLTNQKFQDDRSYNAVITKGIIEKVFTKRKKHTLSDGISEIKKLVLSRRIKNLNIEMYSNERHLVQAIELYENNI